MNDTTTKPPCPTCGSEMAPVDRHPYHPTCVLRCESCGTTRPLGWMGDKAEGEVGDPARPDDIRAKGWMVAVHNDYRLGGDLHTFWLFTKGERAVKGEGRTDTEALNEVRAKIVGA